MIDAKEIKETLLRMEKQLTTLRERLLIVRQNLIEQAFDAGYTPEAIERILSGGQKNG